MTPSFSLQQLAEKFGLAVQGNGDTLIERVASIQSSDPNAITFLANTSYAKFLPSTKVGAVILREQDAAQSPVSCLIAKDPYSAYAKIAALFESTPRYSAGIHPSAVIDPSATIAEDAHIGAQVVIGARSTVQSGAVIGPGCVIGDDCTIGAQSVLIARVTLVTRVRLGQRVRVHPGAVLGADGFGLAMDQGQWIKVPQLGGVNVGDDCEIGANTTIDRGAIDDTVLEQDVRLDNQIQVAHNVHIGAHTAIAGCVAIAGSTKIGRYCLIGGAAGIVGHLEICDKVRINAFSLVTHSIHEPGEYSSGTPLQPSREWRKNAARFKHLDEMARKIAALDKSKD
jgi:UDP-3-O-[3-hydroxymyristoyl] glucosamine N-acyltransferase